MSVPDPYLFVRGVTIGLATLWTLAAFLRMARFGRRWERRLAPLGLPRGWLRRRVLLATLRMTVFDPVNVALAAILIGIWTLPPRT